MQFANTGNTHNCTVCHSPLRIDLFNAFHRPIGEGRSGESVQVQGQAECFYHPGKQAVVTCSGCGRLLCALCDIAINGRNLCTSCIQAGQDKQQIQSLEKGRFLYDSLALNLAFWPMVLYPFFLFTIVTAPVVLYIVLRYWHTTKEGVVPRSKLRFLLAFLIAGGELVFIALTISALFF